MSKSVHVSDPDQTCSRNETNIYNNLDFRRNGNDDPVSDYIENKCSLTDPTLTKLQDQSPSNTICNQVIILLWYYYTYPNCNLLL